GVVAVRASRSIDRAAARGIGGAIELGNLSGAEAGNALVWWDAGRQKFDVRDEGLHLRGIVRYGAAGLAERHAGIYQLLDRDLGAFASAVAWKRVVEAEDRQPEALRAGLEMATAAGEITRVALGRIADLRPDARVGRRSKIAAASHQTAVSV